MTYKFKSNLIHIPRKIWGNNAGGTCLTPSNYFPNISTFLEVPFLLSLIADLSHFLSHRHKRSQQIKVYSSLQYQSYSLIQSFFFPFNKEVLLTIVSYYAINYWLSFLSLVYILSLPLKKIPAIIFYDDDDNTFKTLPWKQTTFISHFPPAHTYLFAKPHIYN